MSATFTPIDAATIAALNAGEERALEQIFRTHYDALLALAVEKLKDEPSAGPRLVLATVRELWGERAEFHTSAEIEGFLNEELQHRARATRSRMAAVHRFEQKEGGPAAAAHVPPTVDQLWTELSTTLHLPPTDHMTSARRRREQAAHGAAEHIARVSAPRNWRTPAILITVGVLAGVFAIWYADRESDEVAVSELLSAIDARTVITRSGQSGSLTLADSSAVRIGADSRLVIVPRFGRTYRAMGASGTAAVTVAPGNPLPLEIRLGDVSVRADSGELAVRDFSDEPASYILAKVDGVRVTTAEGERTLKAGEMVAIPRDSAVRDASATETATAFAWMDGQLVLRDVTVRSAAAQMSRWYGMDVSVTDSTAAERVISIAVPLASSQAAIAAIEGGGNVRFAWVGKKATFRDAGGRKR